MSTTLQLINTTNIALKNKSTDRPKDKWEKIRQRQKLNTMAISFGYTFNRRKGRYE